MPTTTVDLELLRKPFPAAQVKKNEKGLDYVPIDGYINRWLDTVGVNYGFVVDQSDVILLPDDMKTGSGKRQYLAQVTGTIALLDDKGLIITKRSGVGADVSFDPDKALKTAQAEAFKKASHQFGVALELWDADHRAKLEKSRKVGASVNAMKRGVMELATAKLGRAPEKPSEVAKVFGVKVADLTDEATLRRILTEAGVL